MPDRVILHLRRELKRFHQRSPGPAMIHFAVRLGLYAAAFVAALTVSAPGLRVLAGLAAGVFSGSLFMIGHDACHGSYTPRHGLNQVLGRIAFLPSYHTYSLWDLSHNRIHHVHTNLKGKDFVWTPLSRAELAALPPLRRALYRWCRTPLGLILYYPLELWWPRLVFPRPEYLDRPRRIYTLDRMLVLAFVIAQLAAVAAIGGGAGRGWTAWGQDVGFAVILPWLVFSWMIGFVIYFNHTHPKVPWFDDRAAWSAVPSALRGTVRLTFPRWTRVFASNIMDHVAHHVDPRVPLTRLNAAQQRIEELLPGQIVVQAWSVRELCGILRRCKLYDYDAHRWTDLRGTPTTEPLVPRDPSAPPYPRREPA